MLLNISGRDWTPFILDGEAGYNLSYQDIKVGSDRLTLGGVTHSGRKRTIAVITCVCECLTEEQYQNLLSDTEETYVQITYRDYRPNMGGTSGRTAWFVVTGRPSASPKLETLDTTWLSGVSFTFQER